jgi:Holliday junction DNA helicase RuvA
MIGFIEGTVITSENGKAIIQTSHGLGYEVSTALTLVPSKKVTLFTSHIFRENAQSLFAFESYEDKKLFELLIEVNGVGPKTAFNMISCLGVQVIRKSIMLEDVTTLKKTPGLGKKGAEQIILSLKDKISKMTTHMTYDSHATLSKNQEIGNEQQHIFNEALVACQGLGFKEQHILPLITKLLSEKEFKNTEDLLTTLLKEMR